MIYTESKALYAGDNFLVKRFPMCHTEVKVKLFKMYCSAFYYRALWCYFDTMSFNKVQGSSNRNLHKPFKHSRDCSILQTLLEYNNENLIVLLQKLIYHFRCRLLVSDNLVVSGHC